MDRSAAQAGRFYPGAGDQLREMVAGFMKPCRDAEIAAIGVISPHAGYVYSGAVAGAVLSSVQIPDSVIMLGPNHTGMGRRVAIMSSGTWFLPDLECPVDEKLARALLNSNPLIEEDHKAHQYEHGLEVQLPFLMHKNPNVRHVPLVLGRLSYDECQSLADSLLTVIQQLDRPVLILASSDMNHFEDAKTTKRKDFMALDQVLSRNPRGLYDVVRQNDISMCGMIPTAIMLLVSEQLGSQQTELIRYAHSGEVNGDDRSVVGYAAVAVW